MENGKISFLEWIGIVLFLTFIWTVAFLVSSNRSPNDNDLYDWTILNE